MDINYDISIEKSINSLFDVVSKRVTPIEMERIKAAYNLAAEAHKTQRRKTGEPYIIHPIAVARIVAEELLLGANPIIAAFLHDVVEDTSYTIDDIKTMFGDDVAFLVGTVTKQKKDHYKMSKQLDNYEQMLDSMHYDIRAILIKLADRLHNMRTLSSMRPDKQMKIAGETDYFYAPLANKLGLYDVKTELENLSLKYRCPHEYQFLSDNIEKYKLENDVQIKHFITTIDNCLSEHNIPAHIEVKYRAPYSIWCKMKKQNLDFNHLSYKSYINIIFSDGLKGSEKNTCLSIYSLLTDIFKEKPGEFSNYIDNPKENGYQSFNLKLLDNNGEWQEVHICSERMVRNFRLGCVADRSESNVKIWIEKFRSILKDIAYHSQNEGFLESVVSSFYNDDVMVFTPEGKPVILPKNATVLDFAFEIHSELGKHAMYARINGKLTSVKTILERGDCIEIVANDKCMPQSDWLKYVLSYKAKRFLKSYFAHNTAQNIPSCRHCQPLPGDEVIGFKKPDGTISIHKRDCPSAIKLASKQGDSIVSVNLQEDVNVLYPVCIHIKAIDRYHLLIDLIDSITNELKLSIDQLDTITKDYIVDCIIRFSVHSFNELQTIIAHISNIEGVDEVKRDE